MVIPPSTIIMLCDYAPNTKPLFNGLALAEAYKRGSFRTRINDTEYFIAFTENTKNLFYEEEFLGGMIVIRKKGEPKQGKLENHQFFVHAEAVGLSASPNSILLSPVGSNKPMLFWNYEDITKMREQYRFLYAKRYEESPTQFEVNWGKYQGNKPDFHYYTGRFTF